MTTDTEYDAIFVGGPNDGALLAADGAPVVESEIDGFIHRYVITTKERQHDGGSYTVYNYDGELDPSGAESGVETRDGSGQSPVDRA